MQMFQIQQVQSSAMRRKAVVVIDAGSTGRVCSRRFSSLRAV